VLAAKAEDPNLNLARGLVPATAREPDYIDRMAQQGVARRGF
jgi:hypothetical protein